MKSGLGQFSAWIWQQQQANENISIYVSAASQVHQATVDMASSMIIIFEANWHFGGDLNDFGG